jgi:hypothetical protein
MRRMERERESVESQNTRTIGGADQGIYKPAPVRALNPLPGRFLRAETPDYRRYRHPLANSGSRGPFYFEIRNRKPTARVKDFSLPGNNARRISAG